MRSPNYRMWSLCLLLVVAVMTLALTSGCKDDWQQWAVGAVLANIVAPAVADAWPTILAAMRPLGIVNEETGHLDIGQENIMEFLYTLVPAAQAGNVVAKAQKVEAARAAKAAGARTVVAPRVPEAAR